MPAYFAEAAIRRGQLPHLRQERTPPPPPPSRSELLKLDRFQPQCPAFLTARLAIHQRDHCPTVSAKWNGNCCSISDKAFPQRSDTLANDHVCTLIVHDVAAHSHCHCLFFTRLEPYESIARKCACGKLFNVGSISSRAFHKRRVQGSGS